MGAIQTKFFYNSQGQNRFQWSESFWNVASTLSQAIIDANQLAYLRAAMLGGGASLDYIRCSDTTVFQDSQIGTGPPPVKGIGSAQLAVDNGSPSTNASDFIQTALQIRLEAGSDFKSRAFVNIAGLPDQYTHNLAGSGYRGMADPGWQKVWVPFMNCLLKSKEWGLRTVNRAQGTTPVTAVALVAGQYVVTSATHGLVTGDTALLSKLTGTGSKLGGRYRVSVLTADTFAIPAFKPKTPFTWQSGGTVRKITYLPVATMTNVIPVKIINKKRGNNVFWNVRGRRRNVA